MARWLVRSFIEDGAQADEVVCYRVFDVAKAIRRERVQRLRRVVVTPALSDTEQKAVNETVRKFR
jgi:hypothetical protein